MCPPAEGTTARTGAWPRWGCPTHSPSAEPWGCAQQLQITHHVLNQPPHTRLRIPSAGSSAPHRARAPLHPSTKARWPSHKAAITLPPHLPPSSGRSLPSLPRGELHWYSRPHRAGAQYTGGGW